ncbi:MAG: DUF4293 family protein [Fluviicola sp.]
MLQRPQTLVFIAAAILCFTVSFVPLVGYTPDFSDAPTEIKKQLSDANPQIIVKASGLEYSMNKPTEPKISDEEFEKGMKQANEDLKKQVEARDLGIIFTLGMVGCILLGLSTLSVVFLYKKRKVQIQLGMVLMVVSLGATIGVFIASKMALDTLVSLKLLPTIVDEIGLSASYKIGFFMFPVIAVLLLIGVILVRKDENLVKSLDRLR